MTFNSKKYADVSQSDLDPENWNDFRAHAHRLLDACIDRMEHAKDKPWQPMDDDAREALTIPLPKTPKSTPDVIDTLINDVMPYATGNTHPRFFGWVHGTGMPSCLLADMAASVMNSNCGGRNHGAITVERTVIEWCKEIFDFPSTASGLLTVGTSQATILALVAARVRTLGVDVRQKGIKDGPSLTVYCGQGTHSCVKKALQVIGHGSDILREVKTDGPPKGMSVSDLRDAIERDLQEGHVPLCVVATAGSVNTGTFDDLNAIADLCAEHNIWMHVDGAFGAWARIADAPWCDLASGIDRADSLAFDFHKWMSVQYDCGAILIRDSDLHYNSFSMRPSYLTKQESGLGGGDLWFCDFGTDLSRGFRALKVWTALQNHGLEAFSDVITQNCQHAKYMADLIDASAELTLAAPVVSNVCTFYTSKEDMNTEQQDVYNEAIVHRLQLDGDVVFSTTVLNGRKVMRAAIVNHRTRFEDVKFTIGATINLIRSERL